MRNQEIQIRKEREINFLKEEFNDKKSKLLLILDKWIDLQLKINEFRECRYLKEGLIQRVFEDKSDMLFIRYKKKFLELKSLIEHTDNYISSYMQIYFHDLEEYYTKNKKNIFLLKNNLLDYDKSNYLIEKSFKTYLETDYQDFLNNLHQKYLDYEKQLSNEIKSR